MWTYNYFLGIFSQESYYEGLPGLGGLEEVIVSLNSGEARIIGGWGGIYIYMLYALWNEAREEGGSFFQDAITKLRIIILIKLGIFLHICRNSYVR